MVTPSAAKAIVIENGWLSLTPKSFQDEVVDTCRLQSFDAGQTIYRVGDPPGGMYGLVPGSVAISIAPGEQGPYFAHLARPGTWFGEAAAITQQPRRIGLTAIHGATMLHLPLPRIEKIVKKDPAAWRYFTMLTLGHLDMAIGVCDDLMLRDHVRRLIATLLRLGGCRHGSPAASPPAEIDFAQDDIAKLANVSRTTAGSVLRDLEAKGHIQRSYRRIQIVAPDALRVLLRD